MILNVKIQQGSEKINSIGGISFIGELFKHSAKITQVM